MKKFLLLFLVAFVSLYAYADLNSDGYYRVQNAHSKRYIYILDNRGSYNIASTSADVDAIKLFKDVDRKNSDPSTVMYVSNASGSFYNIGAQGTSLHDILDVYVKIREAETYDGVTAYNIYASNSGLTKYLSDRWSKLSDDEGLPSVDKTDAERRLWYFTPVDSDSDEFFGISPTVAAGGKYYHPFFAGFPVSAKSEGVKFYIVTGIDPIGVAVISEVSGTVPADVPVIVECCNPLATDNRLNVGALSEYGATDGNCLNAVYFDNDDESEEHWNRTAFDRTSMRVLGEVDGKLAFVKAEHDYIPCNQAYLPLGDESLYDFDNLLVMTSDELEAYKAWLSENGLEIITADSVVDAYGADGHLVKEGILKADVNSLGKGLYILRSGNHAEKLLVK